MRRPITAAMLALVVLAWPAHAQLFPSGPSGNADPTPVPPPSGATPVRTLIDITARVQAGGHHEGHCLVLRAGSLEVSAKLAGREPDRATTFDFYRVRGTADMVLAQEVELSRAPFIAKRVIEAGLFCYSLTNLEPEPAGASLSELMALGQDVELRATIAATQ